MSLVSCVPPVIYAYLIEETDTFDQGVGGLGHFGLLFAKALGASEVTAISRTREKEADTKKMGADKFIATDDDKDWATKNASSLDLIVCTVSSHKM